MKTQQKRVAYLAPELPSLSATFVSNENCRVGIEGGNIAFSIKIK